MITAKLRRTLTALAAATTIAVATLPLAACSSGVKADDSNSVCFVSAEQGGLNTYISSHLSDDLKAQAEKTDLSLTVKKSLDDTLDGSCATVITYGTKLAKPAIDAAKDNSSLSFVVHNAVAPEVGVTDRDKANTLAEELPSNVHPYTIDVGQGVELAGYISSGITHSGMMASIIADPSAGYLSQSYLAGVQRYNTEHGSRLEVVNVTQGDDPKVIKPAEIGDEVAQALNKKADIFLAVNKETDKPKSHTGDLNPVFTALGDKRTAVIAVGPDATEQYPKHTSKILTTVTIDTKPIATEIIKAISSNNFDAPIIRGDLRNGTIDVSDFNTYDSWISDEFANDINRVRVELAGGDQNAAKEDKASSSDTKKSDKKDDAKTSDKKSTDDTTKSSSDDEDDSPDQSQSDKDTTSDSDQQTPEDDAETE